MSLLLALIPQHAASFKHVEDTCKHGAAVAAAVCLAACCCRLGTAAATTAAAAAAAPTCACLQLLFADEPKGEKDWAQGAR